MLWHPRHGAPAAGLAILLASFVAGPAAASNGMNMIGYGARSIAMGGADLAVDDSPAAMNINPAGIAECSAQELDLGVGLMDPNLRHTDRMGNRRSDDLQRYPMPFVGYVRPMGGVSVGIGLFVQGGMGAEYDDLRTPFALRLAGAGPPGGAARLAGVAGAAVVPATDGTRTNVMHAKLTPTVAWRVRPSLTVGVGLNLSYSRAELELFPETSLRVDLDGSGVPGDAPGEAFFGMEGSGMEASGYGLRVGFRYRRGRLAVGGVYATETELDFEGGTMTLNLAALGLGKVAYDSDMTGFAWPRQAGLGVAYEITPRVLVAADLERVDWSSAIQTVTITAANPDRPMAPPAQSIPMRMGWKDRWVWAMGMEVEATRRLVWRLGFNHGESPIPDAMLRPLFPAIAEDHATGGIGYSMGSWILDVAVEHALEIEKTNLTADPAINPFGPGSTERLSQTILHFMIRRTLG